MKQRTQEDIEHLVAWIQQHLPGFAICYKDESRLQRLIGWFLWPINRVYMTRYTTVMFGKVYFPSRKIVESWSKDSVYRILRHEFVHLMDAKRFPLWFEFSYLFLFPAFWTFRAFWEMRGYTQDLILEYEDLGYISKATLQFIHQRFIGSEYGWMWGTRGSAWRWLQKVKVQVEAGELTGPYPYTEWGRKKN